MTVFGKAQLWQKRAWWYRYHVVSIPMTVLGKAQFDVCITEDMVRELFQYR